MPATAAPRGKRLALLAGVMAIIALVVAGIAAKDLRREQWLIWQLSSEDEETRMRTVDARVELKSVRAVPALIRLGRTESG